ncbi:S-adenosyl-L-methionine-dependent methyltransferase [Metschnikowia bicuspidata]|uniref:rRNA adenine N(6)-methyltransferase n=1 Tax=Metschnikowia bicuspidata TaxID=27322 RepID=A0A4P9ZCV2_9ASCO|nr:S-adenosyl-L-methionine-dependent methyltransferase [Metschnikowia bicuspidata]
MKLRSWNPRLLQHFASLPKFKSVYNYKYISDAESAQRLIDCMDFRAKYPNSAGNLDIVDIFPGSGLFSTMVNCELQPRNHVVLEKERDNVAVWTSRLKALQASGNRENFRFYPLDGYEWDTYTKLIDEYGAIRPVVQARDRVHDQLLVLANLTAPATGESVLAQWIQCCANQNWLQKYGRVRMFIFVRHASSLKFLAGPTFLKRNRAALKRDIYTDSTLVALLDIVNETHATPGDGFDPAMLFAHQPLVLHNGAVAPTPGDFSMMEIVPRAGLEDLDVFDVDHLCQSLMYKSHLSIRECLAMVGPGAPDDLAPKIREEILEKKPRQLTRKEFLEIYRVYTLWPFKATFVDTVDILMDDYRSF